MSKLMNPPPVAPPVASADYACRTQGTPRSSTRRPRKALAAGSRGLVYVLAKTGRLIRVAVAGLTTFALAIGILFWIVLLRAKRDRSNGPNSGETYSRAARSR